MSVTATSGTAPGPPADTQASPPGAVLPAALPIALDVRGHVADAVRRTVEGSLGWQPVDADTAILVPPAVRLVDIGADVGDGTPTVLLTGTDDPPPEVAEAALRLRPVAVVAWPGEHGALAAAVARATTAPRATAAPVATVRIGAAAGGVGTTTIALALAGLTAWGGDRVLVTSGDVVLLPSSAPTIDPSALVAPDLWSRAAPLEGVPGARAVRTTAPPLDAPIGDTSVRAAVVDLGVAADVDVLVLRPDAAGLDALGRTTAAAVVVVGDGPVPARALATAVAGRRRIDVPWSARVGRAAVVGRVPAALPGRLVRSLSPLVPAGDPG